MIYQMQIDDIQNADDLGAVFAMDESAEPLLSTGFQKPIDRKFGNSRQEVLEVGSS